MGQLAHHPPSYPMDSQPNVRVVEVLRPVAWLRRGWEDMVRLGWKSAAYGFFVAGAGALLLALSWGASYLVPAFIGGFVLVAPFVAIGLYALSRQLEAGERIDMDRALFAWRDNAGSIALFGLMLWLSLLLWERLSAIIFALFYGGQVPDLSRIVADVLVSGQYWPLVIAYMGIGALFAAAVFVFAVVSAPLLVDRPVDAITAALTSLRCCLRNPGAMLLWAALLGGMTALGFATLMFGMALLFPWLAHASWHAYRDLVE
jgi:uncharacterized membrane protein